MKFVNDWGRSDLKYEKDNNCQLSEVVEIIGGGTPKTSVSEYWGGSIPWLSVKDFTNDDRYVVSTEKKITEKGLRYSSTKLLQRDDIIISARGTIGEMAMIPFPMAFNQSCYGIRPKNEKIDNTYLYYLLKSCIASLKNNSHGSVFDTITRETFKSINVNIPKIESQREIAETLASLDNKISLNKQINHHLAGIAESIFKSWFIDYELSDGIKPKDWSEIVLEDISTVQNGFAFKSKDYTDSGIRMIRTTNFDNGYVNDNDVINLPIKFNYVTKYENFKFELFDTVLVMVGASVGKISLITELNLPSLQNQNMWRFRSLDSSIPASFIHFHVKSINEKVSGWSSGSARDFYRKDIFKKAPIDLPTPEILKKFGEITMPLFEKISVNILENKRLVQTRDRLLPKLMSGEISAN